MKNEGDGNMFRDDVKILIPVKDFQETVKGVERMVEKGYSNEEIEKLYSAVSWKYKVTDEKAGL